MDGKIKLIEGNLKEMLEFPISKIFGRKNNFEFLIFKFPED
jgi:hypothetical protein